MTADRFAAALAERLSEALPSGFRVHASGDNVWLRAPDGCGTNGWTGAIDQLDLGDERYVWAAITALSSIQDCVSRTLTSCWPSIDTQGRQMALPSAKLNRRTLEIWFGDEASPVLRLESLAIDS